MLACYEDAFLFLFPKYFTLNRKIGTTYFNYLLTYELNVLFNLSNCDLISIYLFSQTFYIFLVSLSGSKTPIYSCNLGITLLTILEFI